MNQPQSASPRSMGGVSPSVTSRSAMRSQFVNQYLVRRRRARRIVAVMALVLLAAYVGHSLMRVTP